MRPEILSRCRRVRARGFQAEKTGGERSREALDEQPPTHCRVLAYAVKLILEAAAQTTARAFAGRRVRRALDSLGPNPRAIFPAEEFVTWFETVASRSDLACSIDVAVTEGCAWGARKRPKAGSVPPERKRPKAGSDGPLRLGLRGSRRTGSCAPAPRPGGIRGVAGRAAGWRRESRSPAA